MNVPANITKYYQPLDLTVNGYAKRLMKKNFLKSGMFNSLRTSLDDGVNLENSM